MVVDVEVVVVVVVKVVFVVAVIVVVVDARAAASASLVVGAEIDFEVNSYSNINSVIKLFDCMKSSPVRYLNYLHTLPHRSNFVFVPNAWQYIWPS